MIPLSHLNLPCECRWANTDRHDAYVFEIQVARYWQRRHHDAERLGGRRVLHDPSEREAMWKSAYSRTQEIFSQIVDDALSRGMPSGQYQLLLERHVQRRTLAAMGVDRGVTPQTIMERLHTAEAQALRAIPCEVLKTYTGKPGRPRYDSEGQRFAAGMTLQAWRRQAKTNARQMQLTPDETANR
jgi:hypothetical protein